MKTIKVLPVLLILLISGCQQAINYADKAEINMNSDLKARSNYTSTGAKKFPYTSTFPNIVKPSDKTQSTLNDDVRNFYKFWKDTYVRRATITKDGDKWGYVVIADGTGDVPESWGDVKAKSHSEANGYGMIISALMGDKEVFDGLYIMYNNFRSVGNSELMSWVIPENEDKSLVKTYSATDGDIDIAYSLLLADNQWGSTKGYNYKAQAFKMITAIETSLFNSTTKRTTRGDWDSGDLSARYSTRSSDWLVAEFQTFYDYTKNNFWKEAITEIYTMIDKVIETNSPVTHLMPDFIEGIPAKKATAPFLECEGDDDYAWNACRYPWRVGMGYGHYNDVRSKEALDGFVEWAINKCGGNLDNYWAGYALDGSQIGEIDWDPSSPYYKKHNPNKMINYSSNAFFTPLALAATHDSKNQSFINMAWDKIKVSGYPSFFGDTITMQCLLYMSGNWWIPESDSVIDEPPTKPGTPVLESLNVNSPIISWTPSTDDNEVKYYNVYQLMHPGLRRIKTTTTNTVQLMTLQYDYSMEIIVFAYDDKDQRSPESEILTFKTDPFVNDIPTKPTNLVVTGVTETSATVTWTSSVDNGLMGHMVNITGATEKYLNPTQLSWTFTGLTKGTNYTIKIEGLDNWSVRSEAATVAFTTNGGTTPVPVPADPAATGKPSSFSLTKDNWNGNSTYKIIANMWYGQNATLVKLYENGTHIKTIKPAFASPAAQRIEFNLSGKTKGTYVYKIDTINQHGTTTSSNFTYTVTR